MAFGSLIHPSQATAESSANCHTDKEPLMTDSAMQRHAELVARFVNETCSRSLNDFAQEAKLDGETLQQAVERYEIDYAWHVLGSQRMKQEAISQLEDRLERPASDPQKTYVRDVLESAAAGMAPEALMSFDNDVAGQVAGLLAAWFEERRFPSPEEAC
jgi:hypothetical protein